MSYWNEDFGVHPEVDIVYFGFVFGFYLMFSFMACIMLDAAWSWLL